MKKHKGSDVPILKNHVTLLEFHKCMLTKIEETQEQLENEFRINKNCKNVEKLIALEKQFLGILRSKPIDSKLKAIKDGIKLSITRRIRDLFEEQEDNLKDDMDFWIVYFNFAKDFELIDSIDCILTNMITIHCKNIDAWILAISWYSEQKLEIAKLRNILLDAIEELPKNELLYIIALEIELKYIDESITNNTPLPESYLVIANMYLNCALHYIPQTSIRDFLINILSKCNDNVLAFEWNIVCRLGVYNRSEDYFNFIGQRELIGKHLLKDGIVIETNEEQKIQNCIQFYCQAVKWLPTGKMWLYYLELIKRPFISNEAKHKILESAFEENKTRLESFMEEEHYTVLADLSPNGQEDILAIATIKLPRSVNLWLRRLQYLKEIKNEDKFEEVFKKAVEELKEDSTELWKLRI